MTSKRGDLCDECVREYQDGKRAYARMNDWDLICPNTGQRFCKQHWEDEMKHIRVHKVLFGGEEICQES